MCFHTSQTKKVIELQERFNASLQKPEAINLFDRPAYHLNGFAHPTMLIIPQEEPTVLIPAKWGIVPSNKKRADLEAYYKEAVKYGGGLNAQSEKLFDHFIYKQAAHTRRCLIPVTGFFEPHEAKGKKFPFYISRKDNAAFALAGIYTLIEGIPNFTILTKAASPLFEKIHNNKKRQPVFLPQSLEQKWLEDDCSQSDLLEIIHAPYSEEEFYPYTVSKDLFSPKVDSNVKTILNQEHYDPVTILNN